MGRQLHLKWRVVQQTKSERQFAANEEDAWVQLRKTGLDTKYRCVYVKGYWHLYPLTWKDGTPIDEPR